MARESVLPGNADVDSGSRQSHYCNGDGVSPLIACVADDSCLFTGEFFRETAEFPMSKTPSEPLPAIVAQLIDDPIVQMLMEADHVSRREVAELLRAVGVRLEGSPMDSEVAQLSDYRPGVGIMLLNRNNRVFVGRRRKPKGSAWQMPQGGIDSEETPRAAALRELKEEVGTDNADILAESRNWLCYELPAELIGKAWRGRWRGQRQKWFAMRFNGSDAEIKVDGHEFDDWKWVRMGELAGLIVPFKRQVYVRVIAEFHDAVAG
jgi:putative (di)nucleoside polyphosphate hydrolase